MQKYPDVDLVNHRIKGDPDHGYWLYATSKKLVPMNNNKEWWVTLGAGIFWKEDYEYFDKECGADKFKDYRDKSTVRAAYNILKEYRMFENANSK